MSCRKMAHFFLAKVKFRSSLQFWGKVFISIFRENPNFLEYLPEILKFTK